MFAVVVDCKERCEKQNLLQSSQSNYLVKRPKESIFSLFDVAMATNVDVILI